MVKNLKYLFVPVKRVYFLFSKIIKYFFKGVSWLISSKEHTNFSLILNASQISTVSYIVSTFYKINNFKIVEDINHIQNIKIKNEFKKFSKTIDLDFLPKWDYRLIPYILVKNKKIHNVFEFGVDQGRTGYLLNSINSLDSSLKFEYLGVENNKRKGVLLQNNQFNNIKIVYESLQSYLPYIDVNKLRDSVVISSTHEIDSEKFLFEFLSSKSIFPKYLISDKCSEDSEYSKFILKQGYKSTIIPFEDSKNFLDTIYIGIAKFQIS